MTTSVDDEQPAGSPSADEQRPYGLDIPRPRGDKTRHSGDDGNGRDARERERENETLGRLHSESPVVAVVVARDPGDWFDDTLASLAAQDHKAFSILVIDDGSREPVKPRVAAIIPNAFVRRNDTALGYGAAINQIADMVSGAGYYLLCHDDVALASDAVRLLVAEAVRRDAAVVGPKLVSWLDHDRLLAVGIGLDRAGSAIPLIEEDERDQGQHDVAREVVATSGAAVLVRVDVFHELRGFDPAHTSPVPVNVGGKNAKDPKQIDSVSLGPDLGEDIDFCWRVRIAGYNIAIEPLARVAHLAVVHGSSDSTTSANSRVSVDDNDSDSNDSDDNGSGGNNSRGNDSKENEGHENQAPDVEANDRPLTSNDSGAHHRAFGQTVERRARTYRERNRIRSMLVTSSAPRIPFIVPLLVLQTLWRSLSSRHRLLGTATGIRPWGGVWRDRADLRAWRSEVQTGRKVSDRDDLGRLLPIGARARAAFRADVSADSARLWNLAEQSTGVQRAGQFRASLFLFGLVLWLVGSRSFLAGRVPTSGQFMPLGRLRDLFRIDVAGTDAAPALVGLGALRTLLISNRITYVFLTVGMLLIGALSIWRITGALFRAEQESRQLRAGQRRAIRAPQTAVTVAYLATGVGISAIAEGRLDGIVTYGLYPLVLARILRSARRLSTSKSSLPNKIALVAPAAAASAVLLAFSPGALFVLVLTFVVLAVVGVPGLRMDYDPDGPQRNLPRASLGPLALVLVVEVMVLLLPWTVSLFQGTWKWERLGGNGRANDAALSFDSLLRFGTGRAAPSTLLYGLLVAAVVPLLLGSEFRLRRALLGWSLFLSSVCSIWLAGRGWLGPVVPHPTVVLAPAAFGLALAAGIGLITLTSDIRAQKFGWRQVLGAVATVAFVIGCVPLLTAAPSGRWLLPEKTSRASLSWMQSAEGKKNESTGAAVWIGPSSVLPVGGWRLDDYSHFGVAAGGLPQLSEQWPNRYGTFERVIERSLREAIDGSTSRVGKLLPVIRYFVLVERAGPENGLGGSVAETRAAFRRQFDLREVESSSRGVYVFENSSWDRGKDGSRTSPSRGLLRTLRTIQTFGWLFVCAVLLRSRQRRRNRELALLDQERILVEEREDGEWSEQRVGDFLQVFDEPDRFDDLGFSTDGNRPVRRTALVNRPHSSARSNAASTDPGDHQTTGSSTEDESASADSLWAEWSERQRSGQQKQQKSGQQNPLDEDGGTLSDRTTRRHDR